MSDHKFNLWYKEDESDFAAGSALIKKKIYHLAAFHFSQAGEKAIKALLYLNNTRHWGHSVTALLDEYEDIGKPVAIIFEMQQQNSNLTILLPAILEMGSAPRQAIVTMQNK